MSKLFYVVIYICATNALALDFSATLYEKDSKRSKILYTMTHQEKIVDSQTQVINRYYDLDKKLVVEEQVKLQDEILLEYILEQKQTNKIHKFIRAKDSIKFQTIFGEKRKDESEGLTIVMPTTSGPATVPLIQKHWDKILNGESIEVRFAALERMETVGFEYQKFKTVKINNSDAVVIRMKPTSFVIAALVDPIYLTFDTNSKRLLEMQGRAIPKIKKGDDWKDLDAEIVYKYQQHQQLGIQIN